MIIGGASLNQTPIDWENNQRNILAAIDLAKSKNIRLLSLPEMTITGYGCEDLFYTDWLAKAAIEELFKLLPFTHNIAVSVGLPLWIEGKCYNAMAMMDNGELLGFALKQNLANDGVHYEKRWFEAWPIFKQQFLEIGGKEYPVGDLIFEIEGKRVAFEICEDAWLGANRIGFKHITKPNRPDIILNPNASHFAFGKFQQRIDQLAIEGSKAMDVVFVLCNLLGNEGGKMIYDGDVLIAQKGTLKARAKRLSFQHIKLVYSHIDFDQHERSSLMIEDDVESKEENFAQAVALGLFDYLRKSRSKGFVLSLSGGADSATCAVLVREMVRRAVDELGIKGFTEKIGIAATLQATETELMKQLLICAYQGSDNSSKTTFLAAEGVANQLSATFYHWSIRDQVDSYTQTIEKQIGRSLSWQQDDITLQNIQARSRSPIIWMLANLYNSLLITTSNRSEGDVGYTTMDGDSSGSIAPIAGVDKHFIRHWLRWAEQALGYTSLAAINQLPPTAELRPGEYQQTDEDDLMPYELMAQIEALAFVERKSPLQIVLQLAEKTSYSKEQLKVYVQRFFRLWSRNQWKRERTAPSFHLDKMSVDPRSWLRFPILSGGFEKELAELEKLPNT
jgi:NAD+ synthase (glutamine-hydrolysing)